MITVDASIKDRFFDRDAVIRAIGRENVRRLSKMGAFICQRARTAILRRGPKRKVNGRRASSKPGQPPYVWSRDSFATLRNIQFGLSRDNNAVLIGPRAVPSLRLKRSSAKTVPELLEKGGTSRVAVDPNTGEAIGYVPENDSKVVFRAATYEARPFMGPALQAEIAAGTVRDVWSARVA
ncbi:MAG: hypothetical protein U0930_20030 [Pirellulales bacterium]